MKNIIESVLVKHLGKYIDGLKNSLDIGLLDGEVTIQNVSLKPSFINELGLPFTLKFSHIEKIHINIPWTNLKEKSTEVKVQGIYVLLNISYQEVQDTIDPTQLLRSMVERIKLQMKRKWSQGGKQQTFAEKNLIRIVDNAVLKINNIHVRFESYHRNWDYSFGVIMDDITSYTVDQNQNKSFYTRHFTNKEKNLPFKKLLNIDKLQLYFNDAEDVFICNHAHRPRPYLIRMMAHPFPNRPPITTPKKQRSMDEIEAYPSYSIKNLTTISLSAVGSQRFSSDMRYVVDLSVVINSIDVKLGSKQLSQVFHCIQHFYDYGLNIIKNGRKGYDFDQNRQKLYKTLITKICKEEKLTSAQQNQLLIILEQVPLSVLQNITDQIINSVRFDKQMKKITEVRNTEKSKKMLQELLDKREKLDAMQGIEIFKQVCIDFKVYRVNLAICDKKQQQVANFGFIGVALNVHMDLTGEIKIVCNIKNMILMAGGKEMSIDHFDTIHSLLKIQALLCKNQVAALHVRLLKKQMRMTQEVVCSMIGWMSLIRLKPSLLNYIAELLNYSIDITRLMMGFLCSPKRKIFLQLAFPLIRLNLNTHQIALDFGRFVGTSEVNATHFNLQLADPMIVQFDGCPLLQIEKGCIIHMQDRSNKLSYEQIIIGLKGLQMPHPQELIKMTYLLKNGQLLLHLDELNVVDNTEDQLLEGQFYLNKLKGKLKAKISQSELVFFSQELTNFPQQRISLTRTRVYRLIVEGRFFIVFKEEVEKQVNIVEAGGQKAMKTLFQKLKDYIQEISTAFQWQKYYRQLYKEDIATLEEIQDVNLSNNVLMTLTVRCAAVKLALASQATLSLKGIEAGITYNQFNTQAALGLSSVDLNVNGEMVISDTSLKGRYESLQSKVIELQVSKLNYQVRLFSTFSKMIAIFTDYQLMAVALRSQNPRPAIHAPQEDQQRLANIKSQHSRADNINKFLLQYRLSVDLNHVDGEILEYRNKLGSLKLAIWKNRNEPHMSISADFKHILLFSMVELPNFNLAFTPAEVTLEIDSINAQVDLQTIIYEVVKGQGSLILKQIIKSVRDNRIAKEHLKAQREKEKTQKNNEEGEKQEPVVEVQQRKRALQGRINQMRTEIKVTGDLSLGICMKTLQLVNGRFSWSDTLFWLNGECISLVENNGIVKWGSKAADLCMTNFKLKLNSKEILFLIYQINKIKKFFNRNKFDAVAFVQHQFSNPDQQGRVAQGSNTTFSIRIQQFQLVYECGDHNPLLSLRLRPLFLTTQGQVNAISLSVWHLNRQLKLYQPVLEPLQLRVVQRKGSKQLQLSIQQAYLIVSQECLVDSLNELKVLQTIQQQLASDQSIQLEEMGPQEVSHMKQDMADKFFQWYVAPNFHQNIQYSFMLRVANRLGSAAILQVFCGKKQRQRMIFQANEAQTKAIYIPQRTSYHHSYQLIERYEKVQLKLCLMNQFYSARAITASFLLYDRDNHYIKPITFVDANGVEIETRVAVKVIYAEGGYLIDLIGKYAIVSQVPIPLHFRYSDACSINRRTLQAQQQLLLPPWVVDYVTFGVREDEYNHVLRLRPKEEQEETEGFHTLAMPYKQNSKIQVIIHKNAIYQIAKERPKLNYLKHTEAEGQKKQPQKQPQKKSQEKPVQQKAKTEETKTPQLCIYNFNIIASIKLINHLNFPITVNEIVYETKEEKQLLQVYLQKQREFVKVSFGDLSRHQIYIPPLNQPTPLSLKLAQDNFITIFLQVRRNKLQQRIIHLYAQVHLIVNVANLHQLTLITNIYQHRFVVKKQVCNNHSDRPHPAPILKDKFCFNTYHYLLSLEEKYMQIKLNGWTSNEFILFHSDFDKDLHLASDLSGQVEAVFAVSYSCQIVKLENDDEGRKVEPLQCFTTYVMSKYYIINRSQESFVVNGCLLVRPGQKITINNIKFLDFNLRDQLQFKYIDKGIDNATYLLFLRGNQKNQTTQKHDEPSEHLSMVADVDPSQRINDVNNKFEDLSIMRAVSEVTEQSNTARVDTEFKQGELKVGQEGKLQNEDKQAIQGEAEEQSLVKGAPHVVQMSDIQIFAVCRRHCSYNTVSYQVNGWSEWLNVSNRISHPLLLRIKLQEGIVGVQRVMPGTTDRIIAGISDIVEIAVQLQQEAILGQFELDQRLNHTIFLNHCDYTQVALRETKVRVGRLVTVQAVVEGQEQNIHRVQNSLTVKIAKIRVSLVFTQERVRRELVRFSLMGLNMLGMQYKNGLYMLHLHFDSLNGIYKRVSFLMLQAFSGYLEGIQGEFIERINIDLGPLVQITLTDQFIVSSIAQMEALQSILPAGKGEEVTTQDEQTYHINSLGVRAIEIKLCMRKRISEMTEQKSKLLSKMGLSIVEVEDAHIHLSAVQITTPLRQKHINGISKMYTMQSFVGVASGLNILGNPSQFASQFEAGRNRGGVVPFFRSILAGTSNSISKIIGTIGSGVSQLTFDRQFKKHRIHNKNIKAQSFGMGLRIGLKQLAHSFKSGITGVVEQPMQGHREEGGVGALKGVLAGLTGLVTKPLTGIIFAASKTIQGVNSSMTYLDYHRLQRQELITRPLYHKFKLVRPYRAEDELAYNILLNWWEYGEVELVGAYLLQNEEGDSIVDILIITCSELILIDLQTKQVRLKLKTEELLATGKFTEGVVLYYQDGASEEDQDEIVFRLQNDATSRDNLYWTLKGFIGLYAQKGQVWCHQPS